MTDDAEAFQLDANSTWTESVNAFEADARSWMTAADAPQLMALRSIAKQLDGGTFQAALISQFTLIHRALLARRPDPNGGAPTPPGNGRPGVGPSLFEQLGGVWQADAFGADA